MKIDLTAKEVYEILKQRFNSSEVSFRLFFTENEKGRTIRTGQTLAMDGVAPADKSTAVYLGEDHVIVP